MELTVVLAGIPVRLSLRSPAYAACFQPFRTEADPVAAVRVPEDALAEAAPRYEAGTTPEQVEYLELGPRVCDALLPYGRILFHGAAILWRGRVWVFTANSGTGKTTQYMLWKLCFGSEIKILNGDKPLLEFRKDGILVHPSPWRGKEGLGSLDAAPLGGIILLEQSEENRMRRMLPAEAAGPLLTQLLFTRKNADDVRAACALEERLLAQVPVWLLQNRGDAASAALCRDTLMGRKHDIHLTERCGARDRVRRAFSGCRRAGPRQGPCREGHQPAGSLFLEPSAAEAAGERHSPPHSSGLSHSHREGRTGTAPLRRAAGRRGLSDHGRMILKSAPTSLSGRFLWEKACNMGTIRV